jgi:hypothetical protein
MKCYHYVFISLPSLHTVLRLGLKRSPTADLLGEIRIKNLPLPSIRTRVIPQASKMAENRYQEQHPADAKHCAAENLHLFTFAKSPS